MSDKWYSVEQISEMLRLNPRTLRRYINEGRLRANKVGKQFRISGHDLSVFIEGAPDIERKETSALKTEVSAVADIEVGDPAEADRIERTLLAVLNSDDPRLRSSSINIQRSPGRQKLRVMLWGSVEFIKTMLDCIQTLAEEREV